MGNPLSELYDPCTYEQGVPLDLLLQLQAGQAVVWVEETALPLWPEGEGFWLVLSHAQVSEVLRNAGDFSSALGGTQLRNPLSAEDLNYVQQMMLNMDPPEHTRLRRMLIASFTPRAVRRLEERIRVTAAEIVDDMIDGRPHGCCDFTRDVAADMPLITLADLLGMPREDRYLMYDWANRVIGFQDAQYRSSAAFDASCGSALAREAMRLRPEPDAAGDMPDPRSRQGMPDLYRYAHLLAEEKRRQPGDDIMSILLEQIDEEGGRLSIEEFENLFWLFAVAGNETLRNGIPGGMYALLQHPEALTHLQNHRDLLPTAVDEMLRWWTPVMIFRRTAVRDRELDGQRIRAGDKVVVSFLAANHDPTVFPESRRFLIQRSPNPHLSFGHGPHFCLGAQLGRMQMIALFDALLSRLSHIELEAPPTYLRSNFQRGIKTLPIRWTV